MPTSDQQPLIANLLFCFEISRLRKVPFMHDFRKLHQKMVIGAYNRFVRKFKASVAVA